MAASMSRAGSVRLGATTSIFGTSGWTWPRATCSSCEGDGRALAEPAAADPHVDDGQSSGRIDGVRAVEARAPPRIEARDRHLFVRAVVQRIDPVDHEGAAVTDRRVLCR